MSKPPRDPRSKALAVALLVSFLAAAWIVAPLWVGLMLGTVMAFTAQPLHRVLERRLRGNSCLASGCTTLLGGLAMVAGGTAALFVLSRECLALLALAQRRLGGGTLDDLLGERAARALSSMGIDRAYAYDRIQAELEHLSSYTGQAVQVVLATTTGAVLTLIIALWTMYYVLLEWPRIAAEIERLLPLDPRDTRALMLEFRDVGRSAFVATIASAAVQGCLAWIGFALAGVPQALTWSFLLALLSFVPVFGTSMVWLPIALYLVATGHPIRGIFVLAWGSLVVMAVTDYVIRPRLVGVRGQGHPLLTLVSLIGGISVLGLPGLVVGPVILSLFVAIVRIYERDAAVTQAPARGPRDSRLGLRSSA